MHQLVGRLLLHPACVRGRLGLSCKARLLLRLLAFPIGIGFQFLADKSGRCPGNPAPVVGFANFLEVGFAVIIVVHVIFRIIGLAVAVAGARRLVGGIRGRRGGVGVKGFELSSETSAVEGERFEEKGFERWGGAGEERGGEETGGCWA